MNIFLTILSIVLLTVRACPIVTAIDNDTLKRQQNASIEATRVQEGVEATRTKFWENQNNPPEKPNLVQIDAKQVYINCKTQKRVVVTMIPMILEVWPFAVWASDEELQQAGCPR